MIRPQIRVRQTIDNTAAMRHAFRELDASRVLAGIPDDKDARGGDDAPIGNAAIGYIQETGSPAANIPARPFVKPGIKTILPEVRDLLRGAAREALRGNTGGVITAFNKIGLLAVNSIRAKFVDNDWAPLADSTLAARGRIGGKMPKKKRGQAREMPRRPNPLIVTGQLRKAISYVIRGRGE
jgi:hypothetical protein